MASLCKFISIIPATLFAVVVYAAPQEEAGASQLGPREFTRQEIDRGLSVALDTLQQKGYRILEGSKITLQPSTQSPDRTVPLCLRVTYVGPSLPHSLSADEVQLLIDPINKIVIEK